MVALVRPIGQEYVCCALRMVRQEHAIIERLQMCNQHMQSVIYSLNALLDHQCIINFSFKIEGSGIVVYFVSP